MTVRAAHKEVHPLATAVDVIIVVTYNTLLLVVDNAVWQAALSKVIEGSLHVSRIAAAMVAHTAAYHHRVHEQFGLLISSEHKLRLVIKIELVHVYPCAVTRRCVDFVLILHTAMLHTKVQRAALLLLVLDLHPVVASLRHLG